MRIMTIDWKMAIAGLLGALAMSLMPARADDADTDILQQAVVQVLVLPTTGGMITGSGFIVSKDGYIVTNQHVIANEKFITVLLPGEAVPGTPEDLVKLFVRGHVAQLLYYSKTRDLAVLKIGPLNATPLTVSDATVSKNTPVTAIGYPGAADDIFRSPTVDPTVTSGVVGRTYSAPLTDSGDAETIPVIQHSAEINHGNSGGPLFDSCGHVIGVNTWGNSDRLMSGDDGKVYLRTASGVYYANSSLNLISFLRANNIPVTVTSEVCRVSPLEALMQRGLLDGGVAVLLFLLLGTAAFAFRRPRKIVLESVNRAADAVSRRVGGKRRAAASTSNGQETRKRPTPGGGPPQKVRFVGRHDAAPYSFEITRNMLQRSRSGVVIGRMHGGVDILIENDEFSRRHARVYLDGDLVLIEDIGSLNGTQADGIRLVPDLPAPLKSGSVVRLGPLVFDVKFE